MSMPIITIHYIASCIIVSHVTCHNQTNAATPPDTSSGLKSTVTRVLLFFGHEITGITIVWTFQLINLTR